MIPVPIYYSLSFATQRDVKRDNTSNCDHRSMIMLKCTQVFGQHYGFDQSPIYVIGGPKGPSRAGIQTQQEKNGIFRLLTTKDY